LRPTASARNLGLSGSGGGASSAFAMCDETSDANSNVAAMAIRSF
jgi:hypothetical protein